LAVVVVTIADVLEVHNHSGSFNIRSSIAWRKV
jgi:hypothetical protein